jgi:hypothetical protein
MEINFLIFAYRFGPLPRGNSNFRLIKNSLYFRVDSISYVEGAFIFEYPETDENTRRQRTLALPTTINKCPVSTLNGPVKLRKHLCRSFQPYLSEDIYDGSRYEV